MQHASRDFHPRFNADAFASVVKVMGLDPSHSGWDYMRQTKAKLEHLPLASLEAWRAVSQNTETLALACLVMNFDSRFVQRLSNELSVLWESVTLEQWRSAIDRYLSWMSTVLQFEPAMAKSVVSNQLSALADEVLVLEQAQVLFLDQAYTSHNSINNTQS